MDPDVLEFLAEKQRVNIIPTINSNVIHLISGDVGPFRAGLPVQVPLWMAVNLKQQQKCKIQAPDWMDVDVLETIKDREKVSRNFIKMPSEHYMVEAKLLLSAAPDDIPRTDEIRTIIKDIWDMRMSKLRASVDSMMKESGSYAAVDNLTIMEINSIRPILPHALDQLYRLKKAARMHGSTQSQNTTTFNSRLTITPFKS
ncbi:PREDICTED: probable DNA replication complex GINS protein PSF2 [Nicrophorus vespilloides]|uniref:DNA replication complex GINS protein PSF2 n=1 Tax=Nicrophorus vespilloides TaxID=110193 RepID=A0ABM1MH84_NICVS|nr:PREDICTED: probable DNA replication complex GINS protein PSF2 [Nicrophorus vespilloides]